METKKEKYRLMENGAGQAFLLKLVYEPSDNQETLEPKWKPIIQAERDQIKKVMAEMRKGQRDENGIKLIEECEIEVRSNELKV